MINALTATDQALLEGLVASDSTAIKSIYDQVLPSIIYFVKQNSGTETDARDVFQDAMMALFHRLREQEFTLTCTLKSYLRVVCRNLWLKRLRKHGREDQLTPLTEEKVDIDARMDERLEHAERENLLWRHFDALEAGCREILKRFFAGEKLRAIAEQLSTSEGYIKKRKHTCKERLVRAIKADAHFNELKH